MKKLWPTADEALEGILRAGMCAAVGGFGLRGRPEALIELCSVRASTAAICGKITVAEVEVLVEAGEISPEQIRTEFNFRNSHPV